MSWFSFISCGMTVIMAYAFYSVATYDDEELVAEEVPESDMVVNDFTGRYVTLSCLTEAQQSNLMRMIDAGQTNNSGSNADILSALSYIEKAVKDIDPNFRAYIDGREIARSTAKYNQEELDWLSTRKNRLGGKV